MYEPPDLRSYSTFDNSEASLGPLSTYDNKPKEYASCFVTMMNLLNTLIGAEILGIANSITLSGLVLSVALMVCTSLLSYAATIIVIRLQNRTKSESINEMASKLLGRWGGNTLSILTLCFTYSAQVAYLVIGAETIESWLKLAGYPDWTIGWRRSIVVFFYAISLPIALTIPKKMTFLNTASTTAIGFLFVFVIVMIYKTFLYIPLHGINPTCESYIFSFHIFNALAIYAMIFALPAIILPLLNPYDPSLNRRYFLIGGSFLTSFTLILIPSVCGYLMFGSSTEQIIFGSFDTKDFIIQIVRATFFFVVNASFPVVGIAVTTDISSLLFKVHDPSKLDWGRRIKALFIADLPPLLIAMVLPKVRPALEIGGAFGGCLTNFFFPPLLWVKQSNYGWFHWTNILLMIFTLFGLLSAAIATYQAVLDAIHILKTL